MTGSALVMAEQKLRVESGQKSKFAAPHLNQLQPIKNRLDGILYVLSEGSQCGLMKFHEECLDFGEY
ncbi:MAG: hypothetical protein HOP08_09100 [Cyclobacteriaceae bacterium]|nr:hypothetical protein [Cyclobacteriaceae bacterium]